MTVDRVHGTAASHISHPPSSPSSSSSTSSRSSKYPQTTTAASSPQHFGDGVFLPNCRLSADCLQLRTDPRSPPKPVRLYLTSTELVVRRKRTTAAKAAELERDYSVLRYPLEDTDVSESVVSPRTLVVSIASSPRVEEKDSLGEQSWKHPTHRPNADESFEANGDTSCTCSKPHIHCRESGGQEDASNGAHSTAAVSCNTCKCIASARGGEGRGGSRVRRNGSCRLVIVEAFQLCSDEGSVDEWVSSVERTKHKLSLLARKANSSSISDTVSPRTATQPSKVASVSQRDSRRSVLSRLHSHADMVYTSLSSPSSPASERRRRAMAYRHPLKSSSPLTVPRYSSPATHQDHYSGVGRRDTRRLFRRFSFAGSPSLNSPRGNLKETTQGETSKMLYTTATECQGGTERHEVCSSIETTTSKSFLQTNVATKANTSNGCSSMQNSPLLSRRPGLHTHTIPTYCTPNRGIPRSLSYDQSEQDNDRGNRERLPTDDGFSPQLEHLKALISSLQPSHPPPSSSPPPSHSPSPSPPLEVEEQEEEEEEGGGNFKSLLRHKQIRGNKCHVSPRAFGSIRGSESARLSVTSPPIWMGRCARTATGTSSTLPHNSSRGWSRRGSRDVDYESASSTPNSTATLPKRSKTPKIFRRIHRRWQSSSGDKFHEMMDGVSVTPEKSAPDKLYLMPAKEVAVGLTGMDGEMLERIGPQEIEGGAWMKRGEKERLAPNILGMVHSFNQLALLVPTEILEEKTHQQRAKVISAYIQIATKCYYFKNYNSLKAILSGLQSTPIYRLKRTWKEVPSKRRKRFNHLCKLMSEEDNWSAYRSDLTACFLSSTPCIPYLGQFLTQVCHQLSYQQMRKSDKKENESKRRSNSFGDLLLFSDGKKEKISRKRSGSFHQNSPLTNEKKRASTISLSVPTSPLVSDDEDDEENSTKMTGIRIPEMKHTTQNKRLGLSHSVDETSAGQNSSQIRFLVNQRSIDTSESSLDSYRSRNTDPRLKFHSTPVKDINGYIRPSQLPISSNTSFDEASGDHGLDETDFGTETLDSIDTSDLYTLQGVNTETVAVDKRSEIHSRIPSISLQREASQYSLEKGDGEIERVGDGEKERGGEEKKFTWENRTSGNKMIKKSRSLEFSLDKDAGRQSSADLRQTIRNIMAPLHQLSIAHSCHSLDSDSVFSVDDHEVEAEENDEEEEGRRRHVCQQEEDDPLLGLTIDLDLSDMSSQQRDMFTQSLPIPMLFSPTPQAPPKSTSPHPEESREEEEEEEESQLTPSRGERSRQETSAQPVRRSKSVGSSSVGRKWRRKKRVRNAPGAPSTTADTVVSSDPQELLQLYQRQCRECYPSSVCQVDFKTLLASYNHNTETRNYELSFTREP